MGGFDFDAFDFSEGFERLRRGFLGNAADHVPFIQQSHEFNMRYSGFPGWDYYSNPEKLVYGALKTAQAFAFETPDGCWDSYNVEAEALRRREDLDNAGPLPCSLLDRLTRVDQTW